MKISLIFGLFLIFTFLLIFFLIINLYYIYFFWYMKISLIFGLRYEKFFLRPISLYLYLIDKRLVWLVISHTCQATNLDHLGPCTLLDLCHSQSTYLELIVGDNVIFLILII
jgi:hypothetical protein